MYNSYKFFSNEDLGWNQAFHDATKNKDTKKIYALLKEASNIYLDEYYVDHSISELYNSNLSFEKKNKIITNERTNEITTINIV